MNGQTDFTVKAEPEDFKNTLFLAMELTGPAARAEGQCSDGDKLLSAVLVEAILHGTPRLALPRCHRSDALTPLPPIQGPYD
jgi:hypothetical protein